MFKCSFSLLENLPWFWDKKRFSNRQLYVIIDAEVGAKIGVVRRSTDGLWRYFCKNWAPVSFKRGAVAGESIRKRILKVVPLEQGHGLCLMIIG